MAKNSPHPDIQLFDLVNGALDERSAATIEAHLSQCDECASVAGIVRVLKRVGLDSSREGQFQTTGDHPDVSELASYYYAQSKSDERVHIGAHVATCRSCAEAIAQYARAERAAAEYETGASIGGEVPEKAWEMISDWEDSSFGKLKPASQVLGKELLDRLSGLLNKMDVRTEESGASRVENAERIPVLIVNTSGEVRSIEFFEKGTDATGASVLRHPEGSARFDNKPVHALFDLGEKERFVISNLVRRDTVRVEQPQTEADSRHADYIIIED